MVRSIRSAELGPRVEAGELTVDRRGAGGSGMATKTDFVFVSGRIHRVAGAVDARQAGECAGHTTGHDVCRRLRGMGVMAVDTLDVPGPVWHKRGLRRVMDPGHGCNGVDGKFIEFSLDVLCGNIAVVTGITIGFLDVGVE